MGISLHSEKPLSPFSRTDCCTGEEPPQNHPFTYLTDFPVKGSFFSKDTIVSHAPAMGMLGIKASRQSRNRVFHHRTEP